MCMINTNISNNHNLINITYNKFVSNTFMNLIEINMHFHCRKNNIWTIFEKINLIFWEQKVVIILVMREI